VSPAAHDEAGAPPITVALVGRPNAGKSSLFNLLTGGHAKVGNFPGVTVDVLEAQAEHQGRALRVVDLPGLYALASATGDDEEAVARRFLESLAAEGNAVIVQVMDANVPALGLRLTRELRALPMPLVVAATQRDLLEAQGRSLDVAALERALGAPVRLVSARDPADRAALLDAALGALAAPPRVAPEAFDPDALGRRVLSEREATAAQRRARTLTPRLDRVLLHPVVGPVAFVALMAGLFSAVFLVADPATAVVEKAIGALGALVGPRLGDGLVRSFVVDGLLGGAGTVLAFFPQIVVLTVAMELLDASGYLARGVFLVDRALRAAGLGGRSFVPLLTGHACAVPAIAATRIVRDPRERLATILVIPLTTCAARIPTYGLLLTAFFASRGALFRALVFVGLYAAGVLSAMLASAVLRRTAVRGRSLPLVLEMPAYHRPSARLVGRTAWRAGVRFLKDVGTTILAASAVLWVLLNIPMPARLDRAGDTSAMPPAVARMHHSVAAGVGRALEPVTRAAGFDWRINVGLVGSFGARELMVGTLGVISGIEDVGDDTTQLAARLRTQRDPHGRPLYSPATAMGLLAFFVLACQCMSTVAAIRRETRSWRWPLITLAWTYAVAFAAAVVVYQVARALGG